MMRIDVHTHIFPPQMVQERSGYFSGEPMFKLLYDSPKSKMVTAEGLVEAMDRDGVDRAVVFGFPWEDPEWANRHNDYVIEAASRFPERLMALGCVNPLKPYSTKEAERCLQAGAKGLGEIAIYGDCETREALECFEGLVACCRRSRAILLVHANEPVGHWYPGKAPLGLDFYYALARMTAGIPLILAHWGGGLCFYELLKKEAPEVLAHVTYDTAASPFLYQPAVYAQMVQALGPGKILFGSDYPLLPPQRYFQEMESAGLDRQAMDAICGGNAARIFGLQP